ncbi:geobacillin-26 family protein [Paenibacillus agricola]|uniref:Geobacillin-26 family protein n=1 Tax=Paenibacillus agricola TaxID=2716264 RepID=A0ABX0JHP9_9BACL|nr:geobacillin-26 family protein [Paenibacillus agricola]NHN34801.1 geobacillin-26 family protein [Paenibacillus agricola]
MKKSKNIISTTLLSLVLVLSMLAAPVAFAASAPIDSPQSITTQDGVKLTTSIIKETADERTVKVVHGNDVSVVTYNKVTNVFSVQENNAPIVSFTGKSPQTTNPSITPFAFGDLISSGYENWWGSSYKVFDQSPYWENLWDISVAASPVYAVDETSANFSNLNYFRIAVDTTKSSEIAAVAALGSAAAAVIAGVIAAPTTAGASTIIGIALAAGGGAAAGTYCWNAFSAHNDAKFYLSYVI